MAGTTLAGNSDKLLDTGEGLSVSGQRRARAYTWGPCRALVLL